MEFSEITALIPPAADWVSATRLTRGIGADRKYRVVDSENRKLLLRLSAASEYDAKKRVFDLMSLTYRNAGIPMPQPLHLGRSRDGASVYLVLTWLEGEDFDTGIPALTEAEQYRAGYESGQLLRRIHAIAAPDAPTGPAPDWETIFGARLRETLTWYDGSGLRFDRDREIRDFLQRNLSLMRGRPQAVLHSDYHVGNFIRQPDGSLGIIDFDFIRTGDPMEDARWMLFSQGQGHTALANGQIHGYCDGAPSETFFRMMAYYAAFGIFSSLQFQVRRGWTKGVARALETLPERCDDFDGFRGTPPRWYRAP